MKEKPTFTDYIELINMLFDQFTQVQTRTLQYLFVPAYREAGTKTAMLTGAIFCQSAFF